MRTSSSDDTDHDKKSKRRQQKRDYATRKRQQDKDFLKSLETTHRELSRRSKRQKRQNEQLKAWAMYAKSYLSLLQMVTLPPLPGECGPQDRLLHQPQKSARTVSLPEDLLQNDSPRVPGEKVLQRHASDSSGPFITLTPPPRPQRETADRWALDFDRTRSLSASSSGGTEVFDVSAPDVFIATCGVDDHNIDPGHIQSVYVDLTADTAMPTLFADSDARQCQGQGQGQCGLPLTGNLTFLSVDDLKMLPVSYLLPVPLMKDSDIETVVSRPVYGFGCPAGLKMGD